MSKAVVFCVELVPELRGQDGVKVLEVSRDLVFGQFAVLILVGLSQQAICFRLVLVILGDDPVFQLVTVQFSVFVLVQVLVEVTLVRLFCEQKIL